MGCGAVEWRVGWVGVEFGLIDGLKKCKISCKNMRVLKMCKFSFICDLYISKIFYIRSAFFPQLFILFFAPFTIFSTSFPHFFHKFSTTFQQSLSKKFSFLKTTFSCTPPPSPPNKQKKERADFSTPSIYATLTIFSSGLFGASVNLSASFRGHYITSYAICQYYY